MYNPGWGWGYGNQLGMVSRPVQTAVKQPTQPRSAVKQYKGEGGRDASNAGAASSGGYSGRASAAAHGIGMDNYGRVGMAIGGLVGAMVGSPLSGMRLGKSMGLNARANQMAQGYTDVVNNAAGYGISQAEVDRGMTEGSQGGHDSKASTDQMSGPNTGIGSLGTGGEGGIDSAGDGGPAGGGGCFITTATAHHFGWADDCSVLETLRGFRDNVVRHMPNGENDVRHYYSIAPAIARNLTKGDCQGLWDKYLKRAVSAIKAGKYLRAYKIYKNMVTDLENRR